MQKYGENFFQTFQACEFGWGMGDVIINLAKNAPEDFAHQVFAIYANTVHSAETVANHLSGDWPELFADNKISHDEVVQNLLSKAHNLLKISSEKIQNQQDLFIVLGHFKAEEESKHNLLESFKEIREKLNLKNETEKDSIQIEQFRAGLLNKVKALILPEYNYKLPDKIISEVLETPKVELIDNPNDKPIYFPVGISRELDQFEKVWKRELEVSKPVDVISYLLWLDSQ